MKTTKQCIKCKIEKSTIYFYKLKKNEDKTRNTCKECEAKRAKKYREDHIEEITEKSKQRRLNNIELTRKKDKEYREKYKENRIKIQKNYYEKIKHLNIDERKKYLKKHYINNKSIINKNGKEYYLKNKETLNEINRKYRINNKQKVREHGIAWRKIPANKLKQVNYSNKRRYLKKSTSDGTIPINLAFPLSEELEKLLNHQNNKCAICDCEISRENNNIHLDHIFPLSKGGTHTLKNVQWLCADCNRQKGAKIDFKSKRK